MLAQCDYSESSRLLVGCPFELCPSLSLGGLGARTNEAQPHMTNPAPSHIVRGGYGGAFIIVALIMIETNRWEVSTRLSVTEELKALTIVHDLVTT